MFFVGQKVVCVNDDTEEFKTPGHKWTCRGFILKKGEIYTIRSLETGIDNHPTMKLVEVADRSERDKGYRRERFRPLVEKKTDISLFKSMLNGSLKEKKARLNGIKEKEHA